MNLPGASSGTSQGFDLNCEPSFVDGPTSELQLRGENFVGMMITKASDVEAKDSEDDPFELAPIIEAVMKENKRKKRPYQVVVYSVPNLDMEAKSTKLQKNLVTEAEVTSLKGSPKAP